MKHFFTKQRFGAMASVVTSLLIASGCRSASVNSGSEYGSSQGSVNFPPLYRSYDRPQAAPYEDSYQSPMPQPVPPAVLPVPGSSDEELPPSPSAQKSKWNLLPSGFKFPSMTRQTRHVNQTGATATDRGLAKSDRQRKSSLPTLRDDATLVKGEVAKGDVVLPRLSTASTDAMLAPPTLIESEVSTTTMKSAPRAADDSDQLPVVQPQMKTPIQTRYGVIRQWPSLRPQPTANRSDPSNSAANSTDDRNSSSATSEVPQLLPPNL